MRSRQPRFFRPLLLPAFVFASTLRSPPIALALVRGSHTPSPSSRLRGAFSPQVAPATSARSRYGQDRWHWPAFSFRRAANVRLNGDTATNYYRGPAETLLSTAYG